jgi:hypothetical protein
MKSTILMKKSSPPPQSINMRNVMFFRQHIADNYSCFYFLKKKAFVWQSQNCLQQLRSYFWFKELNGSIIYHTTYLTYKAVHAIITTQTEMLNKSKLLQLYL